MDTFVNDTIRLSVNANIDLSGYATLQIRYKKPGCWIATICATDSTYMYYLTSIGDLDQAGEWLIQGMALDAGVHLTGRWCRFMVYDPLREFCTTVAPTTVAPTTAAP